MNEWRVNTDNDDGCMRGLAVSWSLAVRRPSTAIHPAALKLPDAVSTSNASQTKQIAAPRIPQRAQIAGRFFHFIRVARDFSLLPTPPSHIPSAPYTTLASNSKAAAEKQVSICLVGTAFA
ncbi:hypothetical protein EYR40_003134 [Pleurotus pulmonarius]|nr:hypothetical protein EYR40_003134 [Pleurotus pulmonarius]